MKIKTFNVIPNLPERIQLLQNIATNVWFSWNWSAVQLFIRLDAEKWENCHQNLVEMLGKLSSRELEIASRDPSFVANMERVWKQFQDYQNYTTWWSEFHKEERHFQVAYFSMEFGLDVSLPIYSGGLGILSGDHLKSSSDLGIPLVGIGLLYQEGYFQQVLNSDGWQEEGYPENDWYNMPVKQMFDKDGIPLQISVDLVNETLTACIWRVDVGRTPLYLLDTNIPENPVHLRKITSQLYGGDRENRIRQEILLGIGGVRALEVLGITPNVYHINEGHSAFLLLERIRKLIKEQGLTFKEAREVVWSSSVFTTHTPVPAGNEMFDISLIKKYFNTYAHQLTITWDEFLALGRVPDSMGSEFSMTVLALQLSAGCNGVAELHQETSRNMWQGLWKGLPNHEIPIGHVTNGIHSRTWISHDLDEIFERYIGPQFLEEPHKIDLWERIERIPDIELWRLHQIRKERLIFFARKALRSQLARRGGGVTELRSAEEVLDSNALTIGFARRFATYKRADLLLFDAERLNKILLSTDKPVQIIIAGKAHPHDVKGKEIIRELVHYAIQHNVRNHFVFLENYDMNIAKYMVQGVDVWLNLPRRPLEASGTSGMKAAANGVLNISSLDGWWAEAYQPELGWVVGSERLYEDSDVQDKIDANSLYHLLENEVVPLYFDRDRTNIPRSWIKMMKTSMKRLGGYFNSHRMVMEYCEKYYLPAYKANLCMQDNNYQRSKNLSAWREKISEKWSKVRLLTEITQQHFVKSGEVMPIYARVDLHYLSPEDVSVEVMYGPIGSDKEIIDPKLIKMTYQGPQENYAGYSAELPCDRSGRIGYAVRVVPNHSDLLHPFTPLNIIWE